MPALRSRNISEPITPLTVTRRTARRTNTYSAAPAKSVSTRCSTAPPAETTRNKEAPTTMALTFPLEHSLEDVPLESPSNSPLPPVTPSSASASPGFISPSLPAADSPTVELIPFSGTTARKTLSNREERIKRPENAFILFRRHRCRERREEAQSQPTTGGKPKSKPRQAELSKLISHEWKNLPSHERTYWELLAKERKEAHARDFPEYVYRPRRSKSTGSDDRPMALIFKPEDPSTPHPPLPPPQRKVVDSPHTIKIMIPFRSTDSPVGPSDAHQYAYQEIVVPKISSPPKAVASREDKDAIAGDDGESVVTSASVWERYQTSLAPASKRTTKVESLYPPPPSTPFTPHIQPVPQNLSKSDSPFDDVPTLSLSPVTFSLEDAPLLCPPTPLSSDFLASCFPESQEMLMNGGNTSFAPTCLQDAWLWQTSSSTSASSSSMPAGAGPSNATTCELFDDSLNTAAFEDLSFISPTEFGLFDKIDLGFPGDYTIGGGDD